MLELKRDYSAFNISLFDLIQNLEPIISNLTPSVRFLQREFGKGLIIKVAQSKNLLLENLLVLSGFIEPTEANLIKFLTDLYNLYNKHNKLQLE